MKRMAYLAAAILILLGATAATAQSLGDAARAARKSKPQATSTSRHFDNDNLPKDQQLSVVGPESSGDANSSQAPAASAKDSNAADRQKAGEELQSKIDEQKQKIDALSHELDLTQREYRLRAAVVYSDAGNRLRNAAAWDKQDAQYQQELADKQKAIEAAKQQLDAVQEEARKAGVKEKDQE